MDKNKLTSLMRDILNQFPEARPIYESMLAGQRLLSDNEAKIVMSYMAKGFLLANAVAHVIYDRQEQS